MTTKTPSGPVEWRKQPGESCLNVQRWGEGVKVVAPRSPATELTEGMKAYNALREKSLGKNYGIIADTGHLSEKDVRSPWWRRALYRVRVLIGARFR